MSSTLATDHDAQERVLDGDAIQLHVPFQLGLVQLEPEDLRLTPVETHTTDPLHVKPSIPMISVYAGLDFNSSEIVC
jgi:hypothetical protein